MLILILFGLFYFTISQRIMEIPTPELIGGISPIWDDCSQSLYFTDYFKTGQDPSIFRYDYNEDRVYSAYIDGVSGPIFIIPVNDCKKFPNLFAIGAGKDVKIVSWQKGSNVAYVTRTLFTLEQNDPVSLVSLATPGLNGQLYTSTYKFCDGPSNSSVYMYSKQRGVQRLFGDIQTTDGMTIDRKRNIFYHIISCRQLITAYDLDPHTGDICNGRVAIDLSKYNIGARDDLPVGIAVDTNGMLYVANYGGGMILKLNPRTSELIDTYNVGVTALTSMAFGGPCRSILFAVGGKDILDYGTGLTDFEKPRNGYLFKIKDIGAKGFKNERLNV